MILVVTVMKPGRIASHPFTARLKTQAADARVNNGGVMQRFLSFAATTRSLPKSFAVFVQRNNNDYLTKLKLH